MAKTDWQKYLFHIIERAVISTGVFHKGYSTELWQMAGSYKLYVMPRYINTLEEDRKLFSMLDEITRLVIRPGMTDYEKELAFHDFIVQNIEYDTRFEALEDIPESSSQALGVLETGIAICGGYSQLMTLLLNRAGIPCRIVTGVADGELHAWNIVLLNGATYHVDVTWDDPVPIEGNTERNLVHYDYFNVTDAEIGKSHTWIKADYPACVETAENYFVKNNMLVDGIDNLINALEEVVRNRESECVFKLKNINLETLDVGAIINDINRDSNYILAAYSYSYSPESQEISFMMEYK